MDLRHMPSKPALACVRLNDRPSLAYWDGSRLALGLASTAGQQLTLDSLLSLPLTAIETALDPQSALGSGQIALGSLELTAPVESQEVWAAGVTYRRSREARMEEAVSKDIYARVYEARRPELFFKAAGWRVVRPGGTIGVRADSVWDVPEPELAVLCNAYGEIVAYACGNDMSSRSIEGENPLYLPQAKVYDSSCAIGPVAVLASGVDVRSAEIRMTIERDGWLAFEGSASVRDLVRDPGDLIRALRAAYTLPVGAWLLTGTSIVPPATYTAEPGDLVRISIDGLGQLVNVVGRVGEIIPGDAGGAKEASTGEVRPEAPGYTPPAPAG